MKFDPKQKEDSFGGCYAATVSPNVDEIAKDAPVLSFLFTFEDALKLKAILDDATHWMNRVDRSQAEGKRAAVRLNVRLRDLRFYAMRGEMPKNSKPPRREPPTPDEGE